MASASSRPGLFYGWIIVAVAWLANFVTTSINPVVFSFFLDPMSDGLGVSRATLVWGFTIRQVSGGLFAPFLGRIVDAYGTRWPGFVAVLTIGLVLIGFAVTSNIWVIYVLFAISGLTGFGTFGGNLLTIVPAANWFVAKRGRAVAIAGTGGAAGTAVLSLAAALIISKVGWEWAWVALGLLTLVTTVPAYALLMRRRPEDMGLYPDGAPPLPAPAQASGLPLRQEEAWTLGEAMRTRALWCIVAAFSLFSFATAPILLYRVSFWTDLGISPAAIALGVAFDPITVIFTGLLFGYLAERVNLRVLSAAGGLGRGLSVAPMVLGIANPAAIFFHSFTWGIGSGGNGVTQNLAFPNYFGRQHQGTIRGFASPMMIAAGALAGPLTGYLLEAGVSFIVIWQLCLWGMLLAGGGFSLITPPRRRPAPSAGLAPPLP